METADIFSSLVRYHTEVNLPACLPYVRNGELYSPAGRRLQEGSDKDQLYHGFLIVANGDTLVDKLFHERIVLDDTPPKFHSVPTRSDLFSYLSRQEENGDDGAFVYDSKNGRIGHVIELNNTPGKLGEQQNYPLSYAVPADFFTSTGQQKPLGTKTRVAIKLPRAYPEVHAFQIKRSAYGSLGMGKVTHFNRDGLAEEYFLRFNQDTQGIDGVYRTYKSEGGRVVLAEPEIVTPVLTIDSLEERVKSHSEPNESLQHSPL